jgi:hypothetical protein
MKIEIWLLPDGKSVRVKDDSKDIRDELTAQGVVPK